jgi:diaminopimelate decarboxylase
MKKSYDKPFITRTRGGIANKFGGITRTQVITDIEGISVATLAKTYGSPLFVFAERAIREKYRELTAVFARHYPRVQHAWSYKTNYLKAVCAAFHRCGSWAEVVSAMEYEMALGNGIDPAHIIFNGPCKPYGALRRALANGSMVNIDSMDELYDAERIADETDAPVSIGVRVNMALGGTTAWDRFGFNLENGSAHQAVKRAVAGGKVRIAGIHAHIGTFILEPAIYGQQVEKLATFCHALRDEFGIRIDYLDTGGGFASRNRLKGTYLSTADLTPSFEAYAEAMCGRLLNAFSASELPLLILESGRAMIDGAGSLIASVAATKRLSNGMRGVILDAGVNLLFTAFWYDHDIFPTVDRGYPLVDHVLFGPLCMQIDVIREQIKLPHLERGDRVVVKPVGAYNNTQWLQFINLRPNVVMIGETGEIAVIREAEDLGDLQAGERVPSWLSK